VVGATASSPAAHPRRPLVTPTCAAKSTSRTLPTGETAWCAGSPEHREHHVTKKCRRPGVGLGSRLRPRGWARLTQGGLMTRRHRCGGARRPSAQLALPFLFVHEMTSIPNRAPHRAAEPGSPRTIVLYYTYYTQTGVTPNILATYHMSSPSTCGSSSSRTPSAPSPPWRQPHRPPWTLDVVIYGLLIVGLLVAIGIPATTSEWSFAAWSPCSACRGGDPGRHPALVRDFSPDRPCVAMGFWTLGPVVGSSWSASSPPHARPLRAHHPSAGTASSTFGHHVAVCSCWRSSS